MPELLAFVLTVAIHISSFSVGLCQPRIPGTVGAEPFSAKIRYTGPDDPDYPNLIKLTVTMPHMDGKCWVYVFDWILHSCTDAGKDRRGASFQHTPALSLFRLLSGAQIQVQNML